MHLNPSSQRQRRSLITWTLILVSAVVGFVLGVLGYVEYFRSRFAPSAGPSPTDILYYSARLFVVEWDIPAGQRVPMTLDGASFTERRRAQDAAQLHA